ETYMENPNISKEELDEFFSEHKFHAEKLVIAIDLFMSEAGTKPDEKIFDMIIVDLEKMEGLPSGAYSINLHDNNIDKRRGIGNKENSLLRRDPNEVIKE